MPIVVNRHHFESQDEIPGPWIYIGRGTPLGNPYLLKDHGEQDCLRLYKKHLWRKIRDFDRDVIAELRRITPEHRLVCSCAPRPCHGDVVVKAWEWCRERGIVKGETYEEAERKALQDPACH